MSCNCRICIGREDFWKFAVETPTVEVDYLFGIRVPLVVAHQVPNLGLLLGSREQLNLRDYGDKCDILGKGCSRKLLKI